MFPQSGLSFSDEHMALPIGRLPIMYGHRKAKSPVVVLGRQESHFQVVTEKVCVFTIHLAFCQ